MIIPEVNPDHLGLIQIQRKMHDWDNGLIVVKPNCSLMSYVPLVAALQSFGPKRIFVATYQAISGSGKLLSEAPEIEDNVISLPPEEPKSENEPTKILGLLVDGKIVPSEISISAHCERVAVSDGHKAVCSIEFEDLPDEDQVIQAWAEWDPLAGLELPSAPQPPIVWSPEDNFPQTRLHRLLGEGRTAGMPFMAGRVRLGPNNDLKLVGLTHNTIRGAAGGAILTAELLHAKGYLAQA